VAITAAGSRIVGANRLGAGKLRRSPRPDPKGLPDSLVGRRVEVAAPYVAQSPVDNPLTRTRDLLESGCSGAAEVGTVRR
jgi:hypothetical protein